MPRLNKTLLASHLIGWIAFGSLPVLFISGGPSVPHLKDIVGSGIYWLFFLVYLFIFYFHLYVLIPALLGKRKIIAYAAALLIFLSVIIILKPFDKLVSQAGQRGPDTEQADKFSNGPPPPQPATDIKHFPEHPPRRKMNFDIISVFLFVLIILMGLATENLERLKEAREKAAQAETDKVNAELAFLKAQVNPHFLFNTLNNIYSMAVTMNEKTADSIMKLSNIMRYVTDEVQQDFVPLESEIECVSDYIALNTLRLGEKVKINYEITGDSQSKIIVPLLLMPFVENVFKYGVSNHEAVELLIHISIFDDRLELVTKNKIVSFVHKAERTGIGIENTKARLEQVYAGKHSLDIAVENNFYNLHLRIFF